ncbi:LysR family transcriptional regulator [Cedecea neteri]|jgi:DNA-binding transcriptional LysR family regulator|uniref:LysR family transcriptional regulator n=1 Tax=Cedecea neteri TaxID=158822 RepID=A0A089RBU0_9ENTR|nr:LysR family transcriptional regulator [Cedecea neteri]AIR04030.1 LysR family transcriptional regulator [Cedecea neteri]
MNTVNFTLAQIEAFACVCECGTLTKAAKKLNKDRTTVSQLLDYLEIDLGYTLFDRSTRPLTLTEPGKLLYRQARLFLHEAQAFSEAARQMPGQIETRLTLCYDPFTPRDFLLRLVEKLAAEQITLDLLMSERPEAESWLDQGRAHIGIYQALNRSVNDRLQWRAVGSLALAAWAKVGFFKTKPVSLLRLAASTQLMPYRELPDSLAQRIQIADRVIRVNELSLLEKRLCAGEGWAFLPRHFGVENWPGIERLDTEVGDRGLLHPVVALWKPGHIAQSQLEKVMAAIDAAWQEA